MLLDRLTRLSVKLSEQRHLAAVRRGLLSMLPLVMIGSIAVLINNLPIQAYQQFMARVFGADWKNVGATLYNASFGIMSLATCCSVSHSLAATSRAGKEGSASPVISMLVSLAAVATIMYNGTGLPFEWTGSMGFFASLVIACCASEIFTLLCRVVPFEKLRYASETDDMLSGPLHAIVPAIITLLLAAALRLSLNALGVEDIYQLVYSSFSKPFLGLPNTVLTAILVNFIEHLLWFLGIHGTNLFEPVIAELYTAAMNENTANILMGLPPENILTKPFFDVFVYMGGAGCTLCLIIALTIRGRSRDESYLSRAALPMGLFNINEVVIYGLPIIFNLIYIIPFILTPIILTCTSWLAMQTGLVPLTVETVGWSTPPFLSGYIATGSWRGAALQLVNLAIGTMAYMPFVAVAEKSRRLQLQSSHEKIVELSLENNVYVQHKLLTRDDSAGHLARLMSHELRRAIDESEITLHYQPQLNAPGEVIGVEALLRWSHPRYGYIAPQVVVKLAEEGGFITYLGNWIIDEAFRQKSEWLAKGLDVRMCINLSVEQLYSTSLVAEIDAMLRRYGLDPEGIEFEVTESIAVHEDNLPSQTLNRLRELGVRIAIDDFGMGHSSLVYIKMFPVQTIKIDGSLVRDVVTDKSDQEIISSICTLSRSLEMEAVAEFIETQAQRDMLENLGVDVFQGWLYAKAMPAGECFDYVMGEAAEQLEIAGEPIDSEDTAPQRFRHAGWK